MGNEFASKDLTVGQLNAIVKKLGGHEEALRFLRGELEIRPFEHVINLDATPFVPEGWKVEKRQKGGQFRWDTRQVELWLAEGQKNGGCLNGNKLREELTNKSVLNANVLDYLLKHPELIPEEWKSKYVFFWGTIYCNSVGHLCVRCLDWRGVRWGWSYGWLGHDWDDDRPAALLAS